MNEHEKNLTLEELYKLQSLQDRKVVLENAVKNAQKEQNEIEENVEKYIIWHPGQPLELISILLAALSLWRAAIIPSLKGQFVLDDWITFILVAIIVYIIFKLLIGWLALEASLCFDKGTFSYKSRREKAENTYKSELVAAAATLRQAERNLQAFSTSAEYVATENVLPEPFNDIEELAALIRLMEEKKLNTLEQGAEAYQNEKK